MSIDVFPATVLNSTLWNGQTYEEGTFTVTATGFTTTVSGTARYVKIGKQVTLHLPNLEGTSNAATLTLTGIPAGLVADGTYGCACAAQNASATTTSPARIDVSGATTWTVYSSFGSTAWGATATKGLYFAVLSYLTP